MSKVKWVTGAAMLACTSGLVACQAGAGTAPGAAASTGTAPGAAASTGTAPGAGAGTAERSENAAAGGASSRAGTTDPVLSGNREVAIVRVQAFESGLSLKDRLIEVDDDSGRQRFVPTPLGGDRYLIKAYDRPNDHPANDEPSCWQVHNPHTTESLTVHGAVCDTKNPDQWFTITARGERTYAISNGSAFLQHSPASGLILEELGDAPLRSTFRLGDNGPAPTVGG
jgi:hypothetical protein